MRIANAILVLLVVTTIVSVMVYQPLFVEALLLGLSEVFGKIMSCLHWLVPSWGAAFFGFCCVFAGIFVTALCAANPRAELEEKIITLNEWINKLESELKHKEEALKQANLELAEMTLNRDSLRDGIEIIKKDLMKINDENAEALNELTGIVKDYQKRMGFISTVNQF